MTHITERLKETAEKVLGKAKFFPAEKLEIIGTYLDMKITGCERKDIKVRIVGKISKSEEHTYGMMEFVSNEGKLIIRNGYGMEMYPLNRLKLVVEVPKNMPVSIFSEGLAHLEISNMEAKVSLDLSDTFVNFSFSKDLEAKVCKQSKVILTAVRARDVKLNVNGRSQVDIQGGSVIDMLEASIEASEVSSWGHLTEALVFITGGGKLHIEKISKSPTIITDEKFKNDVKIFKVGID